MRGAWLRWRVVYARRDKRYRLAVVAEQRSAARPVCGVAQRHSVYEVVTVDMDEGSSGGPRMVLLPALS